MASRNGFADFTLDRKRPLADQIVARLQGAIGSGAAAPGARLPSIRALAERLGVNRNTVAHAFRELAEKGYVETRFGGGSIVAHPAPVLPALTGAELTGAELTGPALATGGAAAGGAPGGNGARGAAPLTERDWERRFARQVGGYLSAAAAPLFPAGRARLINLFQLRPDTELFPLERFRRCLNTVLRRGGRHLLNYGSPAGYLPLREQIARRLRGLRIQADPSQVLVVTGSQQGIDLLARAFVDPGDGVVVESPMYSIALKILAVNGARLLPYAVGPAGIDLGALEQLSPQQPPKLFYAVPNFQNPTTHSYTLEERAALLRHAARLDSLVIEDASDSELHGDPQRWPALASLDATRRVIHLNTFSKTLVPAVRVGYLCAPAHLVRRLSELKEMTDLSQSLILQAAIAEFMERGYFDEHVTGLRETYRRRMERVLEGLAAALPREVSFTRPDGGLCVWVDLPAHLDAQRVFEHLRGQGVLVSPGSLYQPQAAGRNGIRLAVAAEPEPRLREAFTIIGRELGALLRRPPPTPAEQEYQSMH
jgi:DNA-binding transcriptional MocR family regulator